MPEYYYSSCLFQLSGDIVSDCFRTSGADSDLSCCQPGPDRLTAAQLWRRRCQAREERQTQPDNKRGLMQWVQTFTENSWGKHTGSFQSWSCYNCCYAPVVNDNLLTHSSYTQVLSKVDLRETKGQRSDPAHGHGHQCWEGKLHEPHLIPSGWNDILGFI